MEAKALGFHGIQEGSVAKVEWMERETGNGAKHKKEQEPGWVELKAIMKELSFPRSPVEAMAFLYRKGIIWLVLYNHHFASSLWNLNFVSNTLGNTSKGSLPG